MEHWTWILKGVGSAAALASIFVAVFQGWTKIALAAGAGLVSFALFEVRRMRMYHAKQVDDALEEIKALEQDLPTLQATLSCPSKVTDDGKLRTYTRPDEKDLIEFMAAIGHRPALHDARKRALEHGLVRLARILGLYHAYLGQEGDKWHANNWRAGGRCVNYGTLLYYERTIRRVLEDSKSFLRGERVGGEYEIHNRELKTRPLFKSRVRLFGKAIRSPEEKWGKPARPID
jgi:hypothetical protein